MLTALVPGSMLLITMATVLAKNVLRPALPAMTDRTLSVTARALVPVIALVAAL